MTRNERYFIGFAIVLFVLLVAVGVRAEVGFISGANGERGIIYGDGPVQFTWTLNPQTGVEQTGQVVRPPEPTAPAVWQTPTGAGMIYGLPNEPTQFYSRTDGSNGMIVYPNRPAWNGSARGR